MAQFPDTQRIPLKGDHPCDAALMIDSIYDAQRSSVTEDTLDAALRMSDK